MEHFGEALRSERQRRSVSLEDIAQTTKVAVRSLQALESDAFEKLPGGILSKGIVRSYVRFLGLDEGEWVDRFLDASGQKNPAPVNTDKDWAAFALSVSTHRGGRVTDTKLRWAGVVALLLLLCGLGWMVWGYVHQRVTALSIVSPPSAYAATSAIHTPAPATAVGQVKKKTHHRASHSLR
ncbi:MAG TPA: helix-turn-helix domain-containing protein [Acidobacteriaceae bacterium]|nr:helix-turn-helix domain-containing protein [Acidobacteriaceae bacterium]